MFQEIFKLSDDEMEELKDKHVVVKDLSKHAATQAMEAIIRTAELTDDGGMKFGIFVSAVIHMVRSAVKSMKKTHPAAVPIFTAVMVQILKEE